MTQFAFNNSVAIIEISPFFVNYEKYLSISKISIESRPLLEKANILVKRIKEF